MRKTILTAAVALGAIFLILVFTNPSEKDFERYAGVAFQLDFARNNTGYGHYFNMGRVGYYGIYSVYLIKIGSRQYWYYGVCENFMLIQ